MTTNHIKMNIATAIDPHELVRMLAMLRLRSDLKASAMGVSEHSVLNFSKQEMGALPESLVINIVSDYYIMKKNGVKDKDVFERLDVQRTLQGKKSSTPQSVNLSGYIKHRLKLEFSQVQSLEDKIIDMETLYAIYWFTKASRNAEDWKKADTFANKVISDIHQRYLKKEQEKNQPKDAATSVDTEEETPGLPKKTPRLLFTVMGIAILSVLTYCLYISGLLGFNN